MKKSMLKGMAALLVCAAFASCSHEDVYDPNYAQKQKDASYEAAFIKQFGPISPNQNWDFTQTSSNTTRSLPGEVASPIQQLSFNDSGFAFDWIWESGDPTKGELNNAGFKHLWEDKWNNKYNRELIKAAVEAAESQTWDPSKYEKVYFRIFGATGSINSKGSLTYGYQTFGVHNPTDDKNYWLAYAWNVKYNYWVSGKDFMARPRCLDFNELPKDASFFIISQDYYEVNGKNGSGPQAIYASEHALTEFKEVVWTDENGDSYTFWAFKCYNSDKTKVGDLILWVKTVERAATTTLKRYMCEDLGGNGDIDFNDIVFDITENSDGQTCILRALGGTLDIAILVNGVQYWRKSLDPNFVTNQMYNTGYKNDPIDYHRVLAEFPVSGWDSQRNNVSIAVYGDGTNAENAVTLVNFPIEGSVPRMIAVDVRKYWQIEQGKIDEISWFETLDE